jgi:ATP-dependent Clp protease ATP-binding subunit ClpX
MKMDGVQLVFDDDALEYIVDMAVEYKLSARGLRSIVETIMMDRMFEIPSSKVEECRITKEYAMQQIGKSCVLNRSV